MSKAFRKSKYKVRLKRSSSIERLQNENEDKTKTQSFNQYSGNETNIWCQNIINQFNRVSSSCLCSHFIISLMLMIHLLFVSVECSGLDPDWLFESESFKW